MIKKVDSSGKLKETEEGFDLLFDKYGEDQSCLAGIETFKAAANKDKELLDMDVITQEEFEMKKKQLLGL